MTKSSKNQDENYDSLINLMEDNPVLFYDTSELDDLDSNKTTDGVTQKTIQDWGVWLEKQMKRDEE